MYSVTVMTCFQLATMVCQNYCYFTDKKIMSEEGRAHGGVRHNFHWKVSLMSPPGEMVVTLPFAFPFRCN